MSSLYARLQLEDKTPRFAECFKKGIEDSGLKNAYLLSEAVKMFDIGWKVWKASARTDRFNQLLDVMANGFKTVQSKCQMVLTKQSLGEDFDKSIFNRKNYRGDQEYCIRKHLVSIGILDINAYNMVLNPQSVSDAFVDCSYILSSLAGNTYQKMEKHASSCQINVLRQSNFVEYYFKIEFVLPQLELTPENIAKERADFIDKVYSMKENADKLCPE